MCGSKRETRPTMRSSKRTASGFERAMRSTSTFKPCNRVWLQGFLLSQKSFDGGTCRRRNRRRKHFSAASVSLPRLSRLSPAIKHLRMTKAYLHHFSEYGRSDPFADGRTHLCQIICQKDVYMTPKIAKACRLSSLGV